MRGLSGGGERANLGFRRKNRDKSLNCLAFFRYYVPGGVSMDSQNFLSTTNHGTFNTKRIQNEKLIHELMA